MKVTSGGRKARRKLIRGDRGRSHYEISHDQDARIARRGLRRGAVLASGVIVGRRALALAETTQDGPLLVGLAFGARP